MEFKRFLASAAAMVIAVSAVGVCPVVAAETEAGTESSESAEVTFTADNMIFKVIGESEAALMGTEKSVTELEIPSTVVYEDVEYTVTEIGEKAFYRKGIRKITIPPTVKVIGDLAFYYSSLEKLELPEGVEELGDASISYCSNLRSVFLPESVKIIGERLFVSNYYMEYASIPAGVESMGEEIFYGCRSIKTISYGSTEEKWAELAADSPIPENAKMVYNCDNQQIYNTSELELGQKMKAGDIIHYDDKKSGYCGVMNILKANGDYDMVTFMISGNYLLDLDSEFVGTYGSIGYLAPAHENIKYVDLRTLEIGDVIDRDTYLLCYDYETSGILTPIFVPEYYDKVGEGTIKLKSINPETKEAELEAVAEEKSAAGDANGDGEITIADAVILQKYLLSAGAESEVPAAADIDADGVIDVYDMIQMRKLIISDLK